MTSRTYAEQQTGAVDPADREELRLALVMTGGVSLAVWMGGTTREINRVQRREGRYAELLDLTGTDPIVDVISGSSAGGINGALLALATVRKNSIERLRDLWLDDSDIAALFRSPLERDPPSLMKGDEHFLGTLERAFGQLNHPAPPTAEEEELADPEELPPRPIEEPPLHLIITGSLLRGRTTPFVDDFGTVMQDLDHKARFEFRRGSMQHHRLGLPDKEGKTQGLICTHKEAWESRDDFAEPEIHRRLALASRCTASFPIAFEPSLCPVGHSTIEPSRPDMRCHASFNHTSFVVDGGVLVNKPLNPAIKAIYEAIAERQVRRVLAYVVPDPGEASVVLEGENEALPTIVKTLIDSLITLPRNESIGRELSELSERNQKARALRRARMSWLRGGSLEERATALYDEYRDVRAELSVDRVLSALERGAAMLVGPTSDLEGWDRSKLRSALLVERRSVLPSGFPGESWIPSQGRWQWGLEPVEHAALVVLDCVRRAMSLANASPTPDSQEAIAASTLRTARNRLHINLIRFRAFREDQDSQYWQHEAAAALAALRRSRFHRVRTEPDPVGVWASDAFAKWAVDISTQPLVEIVLDTARILRWASPAMRVLIEQILRDDTEPVAIRHEAEALGEMLDALVPPGLSISEVAGLQLMLRLLERQSSTLQDSKPARLSLLRLLAIHVLETVLAPHERVIEQPVELIQISSDAPNCLGANMAPSEKLAGIQLGHFGAFYKRSWRANDWMWGRLDGAYRLTQILLNPNRLRQRRLTRETVVKVLERAALGEEPLRAALEGPGNTWDPQAIRKELEFLDNPELPLPRDLPSCTRAAARRIQLEIIEEELPAVAFSVGFDVNDGAAERASATTFADRFAMVSENGQLSPSAALALFPACRVGRERIMDERHSDRFARTLGDVTGITVSAARGARSGLPAPMRAMLSSLRGFALTLWILARSSVEKGRWAAAVTTGLLAVGGALVALAILAEDPPGLFVSIGAALVAAGLLIASLRAGAVWTMVPLLSGLMIALLPFTAGWILRAADPSPGSRWRTMLDSLERHQDELSQIFLVIALIITSMFLGVIHRRPRVVQDAGEDPMKG